MAAVQHLCQRAILLRHGAIEVCGDSVEAVEQVLWRHRITEHLLSSGRGAEVDGPENGPEAPRRMVD